MDEGGKKRGNEEGREEESYLEKHGSAGLTPRNQKGVHHEGKM